MENTLEHKARFFALYYGQKVLCIRKSNEPKLYVGFDDFTPKEKLQTDYLELKSLSSITDEDAIEVAKICSSYGVGDIFKWEYKTAPNAKMYIPLKNGYGQERGESLLYFYDDGDIDMFHPNIGGKGGHRDIPSVIWSNIVDYLRSKGYALPFMGLSVEKMIEYGWIKTV